jgi:pectinesterase inhibitor-like protein
MKPSTARVLSAATAVTAIVAALALVGVPGAGATPETTCAAAAAARDRRVDYGFCVSRLSHHHDSPDADTWGLAKVAADVGVATAGDAVYDIKALLASKPGGKQRAARAGLEQCRALYDAAGLAFAEASDGINRRDYAAGKARAEEAASLARRCGGAFARAGVVPPPPQVARWGEECAKIAVVCTAVTDLIK